MLSILKDFSTIYPAKNSRLFSGVDKPLTGRAERAIFRLRATSSRIDMADALMRPSFVTLGYEGQYGQMLGALRYCQRIRNQYAHCHWADDESEGKLFFVDLEETAEASEGWIHGWRHVDVPLLESQEDYFVYTQSWLLHLEYIVSQSSEKPIYPAFPAPQVQSRPPLHNPASQHVPRWLSEEEKAHHLLRAQEAESRDRSR
jgi:hypothetical protein